MRGIDDRIKQLIEEVVAISLSPENPSKYIKDLESYEKRHLSKSRNRIALNYSDGEDSYTREFDRRTGRLLTKLDIPGDFEVNCGHPYYVNPLLYVGSSLFLAGPGLVLKIDNQGTLFKICTSDDTPLPGLDLTLHSLISGGNIFGMRLSKDRKSIVFHETHVDDYLDVRFNPKTNVFSVKIKIDEAAQHMIDYFQYNRKELAKEEGEYLITPVKIDLNIRQ